jgi:hypothetical protein
MTFSSCLAQVRAATKNLINRAVMIEFGREIHANVNRS